MALFPTVLDFPDELIGPLMNAVGGVVLAWGSAEASLNLCVVTIFNRAGGQPFAKNGEIPVALKRKLDFLRPCLRQIPALEPYRDTGLALCERTGQTGAHRNRLLHAFISDFDTATQRFTFTGLGSQKDQALITGQSKLAVHDVVKIGEVCMALGTDLAEFAGDLARAFVR